MWAGRGYVELMRAGDSVPRRLVAFTLTVVASALVCGPVVGTAAAEDGQITQKPGSNGCYSSVSDCLPAPSLPNAANVEVSPDGSRLYATAGDGLMVFDRSSDGSLLAKPLPAGCVVLESQTVATGCAPARMVSNTRGLVASGDGENLYAASDSSIAVFDISEDGSITQKAGNPGCVSTLSGCTPGEAMSSGFGGGQLAISPDGSQVFRTDPIADSLTIFDRDNTGALTQGIGDSGCFQPVGTLTCTFSNHLDGAAEVAISPDGRSVYVASVESDAIAIFDRDSSGTLIQKALPAGCVSAAGAGGCTAGRGLDGAAGVTVSADGETVYVSGRESDAIAIFDRSPNGLLTQRQATAGCVAATAAEGCAQARAMDGTYRTRISPDGGSLYGITGNAQAILTFDRSADGSITQKPGSSGCVTKDPQADCVTGHELYGLGDLTLSPDGNSLYVASVFASAVLVFDREPRTPDTQDTQAPVMTSLKLTPARFKSAKKGPSVAASGRSRVSFNSSEAATVMFTVERLLPGRKVGKRCLKPTRANRKKKPCTRITRVRGSFIREAAAGDNFFRFTGRVGGRSLKPGRYRLAAQATDPAGNSSGKVRSSFTIKRG